MLGKVYESDLHVRCPARHNVFTYVNFYQLRNIKRQNNVVIWEEIQHMTIQTNRKNYFIIDQVDTFEII